MSKTITVTITSINYRTLGDYLMDHKSQGWPSKFKGERKASGDFDWEAYASEFLEYHKLVEFYDIKTGTLDVEGFGKINNYYQIVRAFKNYPDIISDIVQKYKAKKDLLSIPLKPGIKFYIPINRIAKATLLGTGIEVVSNNEPAFKAQALIELEQDVGYTKILKQKDEKIHYGDLKMQYPDISVWVWCRSLSDQTFLDDNELEGEIFNITPFVNNLSISYTKTGGNFNMTLSPVVAEKNIETGNWEVKKSSVISKSDLSENISYSDLHTVAEGDLKRSQLLFHNIISTNDIVFVRFETLKLEKDQRINDDKKFVINKSNLSGRIYDLIGLVDKNTITSNFENYTSEVIISGRDLSKLFIEDGSYFYSMENKQGILHIQGGASRKNTMTQRMISDSAYLYLGLFYNNSIEDILKFVIQQVANISVAPNSLFDSYKERLNYRYKNEFFNDDTKDFEIDSALEENRRKLLLLEKEIKFNIKVNKNITENEDFVFSRLEPFIENTINSYNENNAKIAKISNRYNGWLEHTYNGDIIQENKLPELLSIKELYIEDISEIINKIYQYIILKNSSLKLKDVHSNPTEPADGIWGIVKLVIDKKVAKRLVIDSSLSSASGSLMNFIKKIAQEPFVELFMDTYKDQYYIIVRQPPTDKVGMLSYLTGHYQDYNNIFETDDIDINRSAIVDVHEIDIASDTLSIDDSRIYSWYNFTPQSYLLGSSTKFSTLFIPAIYFPEYTRIWGAKSLDLVHNYMNHYSTYKNQDAENGGVNSMTKQTYIDMKYVIESNQYNPFSRSGSIVIKGGDRRIKVGNPIRLLSTGEIFWVDSVNNSFSISEGNIERSTTVQVSNGLVEAFIYGVKGSELNDIFKDQNFKFTPDKTFSYFDIVNTDLILDKKKTVDVYEDITTEEIVEVTGDVEDDLLNPEDDNYKNPVTEHILKGYDDPNRTFASVSELWNKDLIYKQLNKGTFNFTGVGSVENYELLLQLRPEVRGTFISFLNEVIKLGWVVTLNEVGRTSTQQAIYYARNKTHGERNAKPGTSKHEIGLAIDMNATSIKKINGIKANTTLRKQGMKSFWLKSGIIEIAKRYGLIWGDFNGYEDHVHFEIPFNIKENKIYEQPQISNSGTQTITNKKVERVKTGTKEVIDETVVFSNFKVDIEIFNFFLRKQQMGSNIKNLKINKEHLKTLDDLITKNIINKDQLSQLKSSSNIKLKTT